MKSRNTTTSHLFFAAITGAFLFAAGPAPANAESWEFRTAAQEVTGTRDIEAGNIEKGIRVLEFHYASTPFENKGAVLTNLCIAYAMKRDFQTAMDYCNRAVARRRGSREAYNNRGVLQALQGDYAAAISDFKKAGCGKECPAELVNQSNKRMAVARRNLDRAQTQLAIQTQKDQGIRVSDSK